MMRSTPALALVLASTLTACGAAEPAEPTSEAPSGAPEIAGLPRLTIGLAHTTVRFRAIVDEALAAAGEPLPLPPRGPSLREFHRWVDDRLAPWLQRRGERLARATAALERLRTGDADERTLGAAIVGFLYADTVQQVLEAEQPRGLDPTAEDRLLTALRRQLDPLEARSEEAFRVCVATATGAPAHIDAWRLYCEDHLRVPLEGASAPERGELEDASAPERGEDETGSEDR
jgi:hypothetical protein